MKFMINFTHIDGAWEKLTPSELENIQAQLGHSSLATTDRYLRHIAPQQLIDAVRRRAWDV